MLARILIALFLICFVFAIIVGSQISGDVTPAGSVLLSARGASGITGDATLATHDQVTFITLSVRGLPPQAHYHVAVVDADCASSPRWVGTLDANTLGDASGTVEANGIVDKTWWIALGSDPQDANSIKACGQADISGKPPTSPGTSTPSPSGPTIDVTVIVDP